MTPSPPPPPTPPLPSEPPPDGLGGWLRRTGHRRWRIGRQLVSANWQMALAYRGMMLLDAFRVLLMPTVLALAWMSVDRRGEGFAEGDYLLYYLALPVVAKLSECWTVSSLPEEIRNGTLNRHLLKPLHPLWFHVAEHLTQKALQLLHLVPVVAVVAWAVGPRLPALDLAPARLVVLGAALAMGVILRFTMTTAIAMTGFWIERVENLNLVFNAAVWALLGGMVVPLETMPSWLRWITDLLPYRYSLSFPIEILRGRIAPAAAAAGFGVAAAWCLAWFVVGRALWRRGLRAYTAYGG